MPLYEYKCRKCGHTFERLTNFGAENPECLNKCEGKDPPYCGGETARLISKGSFTLKGGGWEKDGYRSS